MNFKEKRGIQEREREREREEPPNGTKNNPKYRQCEEVPRNSLQNDRIRWKYTARKRSRGREGKRGIEREENFIRDLQRE
jgi:hypothetical protein